MIDKRSKKRLNKCQDAFNDLRYTFNHHINGSEYNCLNGFANSRPILNYDVAHGFYCFAKLLNE